MTILLSTAISGFTNAYLMQRLQQAGVTTALASPVTAGYLADLYPDYLNYDNIVKPLNTLLQHLLVNPTPASVDIVKDLARHANRVQKLFIKDDGMFNSISRAYLVQYNQVAYDTGEDPYGERFEQDMKKNLYNHRFELMQPDRDVLLGWYTSVFYALDTLFLATKPAALNALRLELSPAQEQWFAALTAWFERLHHINIPAIPGIGTSYDITGGDHADK